MFEDHNDTILDILKETDALTPDQLEEINHVHMETGKALANAVFDSGLINRGQLLELIAEYLSLEYIHHPPGAIDDEVLRQVTPSTARMYRVVPLRADEASISG